MSIHTDGSCSPEYCISQTADRIEETCKRSCSSRNQYVEICEPCGGQVGINGEKIYSLLSSSSGSPETPPARIHKTHIYPQLTIAGTGKTTTITAKIAYMVEKENIDPSQILALTFSKEAVRHMRENVGILLQGKELIVKTFHSFCAELNKMSPIP